MHTLFCSHLNTDFQSITYRCSISSGHDSVLVQQCEQEITLLHQIIINLTFITLGVVTWQTIIFSEVRPIKA